jgi:hypothetical protein
MGPCTLKSAETLLVLGAAAEYGLAAVELGKARGARVVAAVSSEDKAEAAKAAGADEAVVYPRGPFDKGRQQASLTCSRKRSAARARRHLRPCRRATIASLPARHRMGRPLSRVGFPRRHSQAPAQPHPPQELRRARGLLGRLRPRAIRKRTRAHVEELFALWTPERSAPASAPPTRSSAPASHRRHGRAAGDRQVGGRDRLRRSALLSAAMLLAACRPARSRRAPPHRKRQAPSQPILPSRRRSGSASASGKSKRWMAAAARRAPPDPLLVGRSGGEDRASASPSLHWPACPTPPLCASTAVPRRTSDPIHLHTRSDPIEQRLERSLLLPRTSRSKVTEVSPSPRRAAPPAFTAVRTGAQPAGQTSIVPA